MHMKACVLKACIGRFGPIDTEVGVRIDAIEYIDQLECLLDKAIEATSWIGLFEAYREAELPKPLIAPVACESHRE